jgi:predicted DNA-binding transcriptional regulator YafY
LIDFRYVSRDDEISRRSLLCWQCGRNSKRIYVRGYCPFREALRTFRVDRMQDVVVMQAGRYISADDVEAYFAAYAAGRTEERAGLLLGSWDD